MPASKVKQYLDREEIEYEVLFHSPAFTAQEVAAETHISGKQLAKTVMVKVEGKLAMVVLPAAFQIDFARLKVAVGKRRIELATEQEFKDAFPDCEVGATPPFGQLYGLDVIVEESLGDELVIAFCAGTHTELIQMAYRDFERLVQPKVAAFAALVEP